MCGENVKFMVFTFLENVLNQDISTHVFVPHSKVQAEFFENLLLPTTEREGENYHFLYQYSIRKYEDSMEHGYLHFV